MAPLRGTTAGPECQSLALFACLYTLFEAVKWGVRLAAGGNWVRCTWVTRFEAGNQLGSIPARPVNKLPASSLFFSPVVSRCKFLCLNCCAALFRDASTVGSYARPVMGFTPPLKRDRGECTDVCPTLRACNPFAAGSGSPMIDIMPVDCMPPKRRVFGTPSPARHRFILSDRVL